MLAKAKIGFNFQPLAGPPINVSKDEIIHIDDPMIYCDLYKVNFIDEIEDKHEIIKSEAE